jgi:hypothetical protein
VLLHLSQGRKRTRHPFRLGSAGDHCQRIVKRQCIRHQDLGMPMKDDLIFSRMRGEWLSVVDILEIDAREEFRRIAILKILGFASHISVRELSVVAAQQLE